MNGLFIFVYCLFNYIFVYFILSLFFFYFFFFEKNPVGKRFGQEKSGRVRGLVKIGQEKFEWLESREEEKDSVGKRFGQEKFGRVRGLVKKNWSRKI